MATTITTTLGKPHYEVIEDLNIKNNHISKGQIYVYNGLAFSPQNYDSENNGGYVVSEETVKDKSKFKELI